MVRLAVTWQEDPDASARVLAVRKIDELGRVEWAIEGDGNRLRALYEAHKRIGAATELNDVLVAICDATFGLVRGCHARHDRPA